MDVPLSPIERVIETMYKLAFDEMQKTGNVKRLERMLLLVGELAGSVDEKTLKDIQDVCEEGLKVPSDGNPTRFASSAKKSGATRGILNGDGLSALQAAVSKVPRKAPSSPVRQAAVSSPLGSGLNSGGGSDKPRPKMHQAPAGVLRPTRLDSRWGDEQERSAEPTPLVPNSNLSSTGTTLLSTPLQRRATLLVEMPVEQETVVVHLDIRYDSPLEVSKPRTYLSLRDSGHFQAYRQKIQVSLHDAVCEKSVFFPLSLSC